MKIRLNLISFVATFIITMTLVTFNSNRNFNKLFNTKKDLQSKVKVYNFLLADKTLRKEYNEKSSALRLQSTSDAMNELLKERERLAKELFTTISNAETNELPGDFKEAWLKLMTDEKYILEIVYPDKSIKAKSAKEVSEEIKSLENEFRSVVNNYGIGIDESGNLIEQNK